MSGKTKYIMGILGNSDDPDVQELVRAIQRNNPHIEIEVVQEIAPGEISVGYRADVLEMLEEDIDLARRTGGYEALREAVRSNHRAVIDWPAQSFKPHVPENWQQKRRTPWRKRK